ncbi:hypothetical protein [Roseovarius sp. 217]|uniref:hypothetical protein n=1 Tax=Roseovarius sp. (strain 217) TaxID=314264 RepID=UPI0000686678|nr:hypothetical protein [Roseovarius sp. 217]EAQ22822.1 hypothetical protein ROS217_18130 [Roseovarius sp. 217]
MPRPAPILASEKTAAALLDMKPAEFRSLVERGALPGPQEIHGFARWRVADLEAIWTGDAMDTGEFEA